MSERGSTSDSAAIIFKMALANCLKQTASRNASAGSGEGLRVANRKKKHEFGSNQRDSSELNSRELSEEIQNKVDQVKYNDNLVKVFAEKETHGNKEKDKLVTQLPVDDSNMGTVEERRSQNPSNRQSKRRIKSNLSQVYDHLSTGGDCSARKPPSDCLNDREESERSGKKSRSACEVKCCSFHSMPNYSSSTDDSELEHYESKQVSQIPYSQRHFCRNPTVVLKATKSESCTQLFRVPYNTPDDKPFHRRSPRPDPNEMPDADTANCLYSSAVVRTMKARTGALVPSYDFVRVNSKPPVSVIDSHCHLDFLFTREKYYNSYSSYRLKNRETFPDCYEGCITVFCEPQTFFMKGEWNSLLQEDGVWAAYGCHPHIVNYYSDEVEAALIQALTDPKVIALGEIGLDYSKRNNCDKYLQKKVLRRQLRISLKVKKPLIIHCREAHYDCMDILKEMVPRDHPIHLHCFTDTWQRATAWLSEFPNLSIGITNVVTYPSAKDVHETARNIPIDRLLLETDTPYFVPRSMSRRWSHPGLVIHAAVKIAELRTDVQLEDLLRRVRQNTYKVYGI